jgi:hypothetical protein
MGGLAKKRFLSLKNREKSRLQDQDIFLRRTIPLLAPDFTARLVGEIQAREDTASKTNCPSSASAALNRRPLGFG